MKRFADDELTPLRQGWTAGYMGTAPRAPHPYPEDVDRGQQWVDGWNAGRAAREKQEEKEC